MDYAVVVLVGTILTLAGFIAGIYAAPGFNGVEQSIKDHVTAEVAKLKAEKTAVVSKVNSKAKQVKSVF